MPSRMPFIGCFRRFPTTRAARMGARPVEPDSHRLPTPTLVCETVVSVISLRSVAAWAALLGGALWLAQGVVLIARGGAEPDPTIEAVTFSCGFVALVAAAGIASLVSSATKSRAVVDDA